MALRRRVAAAALLFLLASPAAADPAPDAIAEARSYYKRGLELYDEGRYEAALAEFLRANQLAPSYRIFQSIGLVQVQLGDNAGAAASLERYLVDGAAQIDAKARAATEKKIAELRDRTAQVAVKTNVEGATIAVDDVVVGTTPLAAPIVVNAGRRRVTAAMHGYEAETKVVVCAEKDRLDLSFELASRVEPVPTSPLPSESAKPLPPPPPIAPSVSQATSAAPLPSTITTARPAAIPWVGWATTGVLVIGAGVSGGIALASLSDLRHAKVDGPSSAADLDAISSRAKGWALASDILTASAVVVGGISLYFTLRAGAHDDGAKVGVGPGSLVLRSTF